MDKASKIPIYVNTVLQVDKACKTKPLDRYGVLIGNLDLIRAQGLLLSAFPGAETGFTTNR